MLALTFRATSARRSATQRSSVVRVNLPPPREGLLHHHLEPLPPARRHSTVHRRESGEFGETGSGSPCRGQRLNLRSEQWIINSKILMTGSQCPAAHNPEVLRKETLLNGHLWGRRRRQSSTRGTGTPSRSRHQCWERHRRQNKILVIGSPFHRISRRAAKPLSRASQAS